MWRDCESCMQFRVRCRGAAQELGFGRAQENARLVRLSAIDDLACGLCAGQHAAEPLRLAFRLGLSPQDGVIARRLFSVQLVLCASPDYPSRHGGPRVNRDSGAAHQ